MIDGMCVAACEKSDLVGN